jgi:deoxycytidylate deaminase
MAGDGHTELGYFDPKDYRNTSYLRSKAQLEVVKSKSPHGQLPIPGQTQGSDEERRSKRAAGHPELFFGIVRTLGASTATVKAELRAQLESCSYQVEEIRISALLADVGDGSGIARRWKQMDLGDRLREAYGGGEAAALVAVWRLIKLRKERAEQQGGGNRPFAWVFSHLMHEREVEILRELYGRRFFVISCDAPFEHRLDHLAQSYRRRAGYSFSQAREEALKRLHRDAGEMNLPAGHEDPLAKQIGRRNRLSVAETFRLGDAYVSANEPEKATHVTRRLVQSIMGHPFHSLTLDELGMAAAFEASLASGALARRVGAAVMLDEQICAVGYNDVPKYGGGTYHAESSPDWREQVWGYDPSDRERKAIVADLLNRLSDVDGFLAEEFRKLDGEKRTERVLGEPHIRDSRVFDIIEYGRVVHAEVAAITGAARRGIPLSGGTLFTTTYPCHDCMRVIVAAGIHRVVYVEPYTKSHGAELQEDSVNVVSIHGRQVGKVSVELFSGISQRRFSDLFSWVHRKDASSTFEGNALTWDARKATVRPSIFCSEASDAEQMAQWAKETYAMSLVEYAYPAMARFVNQDLVPPPMEKLKLDVSKAEDEHSAEGDEGLRVLRRISGLLDVVNRLFAGIFSR